MVQANPQPLRWQLESSSQMKPIVVDQWVPLLRDLGIPLIACLVFAFMVLKVLAILRENLAAMRQIVAKQDQATRELLSYIRASAVPERPRRRASAPKGPTEDAEVKL